MLPIDLPSHSFNPKRLNPGFNNWLGHLPFARDLIASCRPSRLVELGTHYGESYFGFCQSVVESGIQCACYAVDTWKGDEHSGLYGEEVFADVSAYNQNHYASFSNLLRMTFDDAVAHFEDGSLDLLHIDGLHTYNAVAHDVQNWFSKIRPGGILLLHDVAVKENAFEVWRLWEELQVKFPAFTFHHHSGLGVLRKPGSSAECDDLLAEILQASQEKQAEVRRYYVACAKSLARLAEDGARYRTLQELLAETERRFADADTRLKEKTAEAAHYWNLQNELAQKLVDASTRLNERTSEAQHYKNVLREKTSEAQHYMNLLQEKTSEAQHYTNLLREKSSEAQHYKNVVQEKTLEAEHLNRLLENRTAGAETENV